MIETEQGYKFERSGRVFYANGYIGINPHLEVAQGYDGGIVPEPMSDEEEDKGTQLTKEEKAELADYMISLWVKFKGLD